MGRITSMFQQTQLHRARPPRQVRRVHDEISRRHLLLAAPYADPVVHEVNSQASLLDAVGPKQLGDGFAHRLPVVGQRQADPLRVSPQPLPVPLERKRHTVVDAQRAENTPAVQQTRLSWRKPYPLQRQNPVVMKDMFMHADGLQYKVTPWP